MRRRRTEPARRCRSNQKSNESEHPTSNIQRSTSNGVDSGIHWMFDVGCWVLDVRPGFGIRISILAMTSEYEFFLDSSRCIGCQACVQACGECGTHRGVSMIHLEYVDRATSTQTSPVVCMHCENPTCAKVCPADAIKQTDDGIVQSSLKPRCIGCSNCVLACPFGVPRYKVEIDQMMKCDMCYDRTSIGKKPMCATVCPSGAL